jgi:hypothetical protein
LPRFLVAKQGDRDAACAQQLDRRAALAARQRLGTQYLQVAAGTLGVNQRMLDGAAE